MYLLPFNHPDFPRDPNGWTFFITCEDEDGEVAKFIDAMERAGPQFEDAWLHASKLARSGKPWKTLIPDAKKLHDVGKVKIKRVSGRHQEHTVWSFKHGRIRILWCYAGPNKVILFGNTIYKDQNTIDPADVAIAGNELERYFTALDTGKLKIAGGKDNEQAFGPLF